MGVYDLSYRTIPGYYPPQNVFLAGVKIGHVEYEENGGWTAYDRDGDWVANEPSKSAAAQFLARATSQDVAP